MKRKIAGVLTLICFLMLALQVPVFAADEEETIELSIEQAVSRAVRYSNSLESARLDRDIADEDRGTISRYWHPSYATDYHPEAEGVPELGIPNLYQAKPSVEYAFDAAMKNEEIQKDMVVTETYKVYYDVLEAIEGLAVAEKAYASAEQEFEIKKLHMQVGMLSPIEYQSAVTSFADQKTKLTAAQNKLENAYIDFNQQVGLQPSDRPVLTDKPEFETLEVTHLDSKVRSIVKNSPSQWIAKEGANLRERLSNMPGSSDKDEFEADKADLSADDLYDATIQGVYSAYYGIKDMEETYNMLQEAVTTAQKAYDIAQVQYEVGMATEADVLAAEVKLAEAEQGVLTLVCQHDLMKLCFEKPWCLGAAMGGSSSAM